MDNPCWSGSPVLLAERVVPARYALTAEDFPTRFRTTGFAIADSVGHAGSGLGVFLVIGALVELPIFGTMLALAGFLIFGGIINLLASKTRHKNLESISS